MNKSFPMWAILSLTTGCLLGGSFGDVHELAEHLAGHPIWTHEFADKAMWTKLCDLLFAQHPDLRETLTPSVKITRDNWEQQRDLLVAKYGTERMITKGSSERTESPIESMQRIAPGKPVVVGGD